MIQVTFSGCHLVTFRGKHVHPSAASNQFLVKKIVAKRGCPGRGGGRGQSSVNQHRDTAGWCTSYIHSRYRGLCDRTQTFMVSYKQCVRAWIAAFLCTQTFSGCGQTVWTCSECTHTVSKRRHHVRPSPFIVFRE